MFTSPHLHVDVFVVVPVERSRAVRVAEPEIDCIGCFAEGYAGKGGTGGGDVGEEGEELVAEVVVFFLTIP